MNKPINLTDRILNQVSNNTYGVEEVKEEVEFERGEEKRFVKRSPSQEKEGSRKGKNKDSLKIYFDSEINHILDKIKDYDPKDPKNRHSRSTSRSTQKKSSSRYKSKTKVSKKKSKVSFQTQPKTSNVFKDVVTKMQVVK